MPSANMWGLRIGNPRVRTARPRGTEFLWPGTAINQIKRWNAIARTAGCGYWLETQNGAIAGLNQLVACPIQQNLQGFFYSGIICVHAVRIRCNLHSATILEGYEKKTDADVYQPQSPCKDHNKRAVHSAWLPSIVSQRALPTVTVCPTCRCFLSPWPTLPG